MRRSSPRKEYTNRAQWAAKLEGIAKSVEAEKPSRSEILKACRREHNALERSCADYAAKKHGIRLYKSDSEAQLTAHGFRRAAVAPGMPDMITAIPPTGRFAGFEFKAGNNHSLRPIQKQVHEELTAQGAAPFKIRTLNEFIAVFEGLLQIEREKYDALSRSEQHTPRCLAISDSEPKGGIAHETEIA